MERDNTLSLDVCCKTGYNAYYLLISCFLYAIKLSREQKSALLHAAKQVYFAYLALDFFKSKECVFTNHSESKSDDHPATLFKIINNLVFPLNSMNVSVRIADRDWILEVCATADKGMRSGKYGLRSLINF